MMQEFLTYVTLGFQHITDPNGLDHVLFLLALTAIYRWRDWRALLAVVTAFTLGHSITLALAVTGVAAPPAPLVEFLIPVTIVAMAVENLFRREPLAGAGGGLARPMLAMLFGLVHGAGFANYLQALFAGSVAMPLFGFNVGIELGQIAVLGAAMALLTLADVALAAVRTPSAVRSPFRVRVVAVSSLVSLVALQWAVERAPW